MTGGKKTASGPLAMKREARELAGVLAGQAEGARRAGGRGWRSWIAKSAFWRPSWSVCAACSRRAKKSAWRSITKCASWPTILSRANSRLSVARLELDRLKRDAERSHEQRERNQQAVAEKEELREQREQELEDQRQFLEKLEVRSRRARRRAFRAARGVGRVWKSAIAASAPPWAAWKRSSKEATARLSADRSGDRAAGRASRRPAGRQIELDRKLARAGRAGACKPKPPVNSWPPKKPACARRSPPPKKS